MNYKQFLDKIANDLKNVILTETDAFILATEDFGWENSRYIGDLFRIAHIERYSDKNLEVLHFTCFPNVYNPDPIFGFDTITTDKKPLASFLDWSPVDNVKSLNKPDYNFENLYTLPTWAQAIFSNNFIAVVPRETELEFIGNFAVESFKEYVKMLANSKPSPDRVNYIVAKQNFYCDQQQQNQRTFNVLKSKLGEERARYFMETILFPKVHTK